MKIDNVLFPEHIELVRAATEALGHELKATVLNYNEGPELEFEEYLLHRYNIERLLERFEHVQVYGTKGGFFSMNYLKITVSGLKKPEEGKAP